MSRTIHRQSRPALTRPAFTLVEVMCALVLVVVALLTFQGAITTTLRRTADSHRETLGAELARQRIERLASARCANGAGTDSVNGTIFTWRANAMSGSTIMVSARLQYPTATGLHVDTYTTRVTCH